MSNTQLVDMIAACSKPHLDKEEKIGKMMRNSARSNLREWLRHWEVGARRYRKTVQAQQGMTTKQIESARRDWKIAGRKETWESFLLKTRAALDDLNLLQIPGISRA